MLWATVQPQKRTQDVTEDEFHAAWCKRMPLGWVEHSRATHAAYALFRRQARRCRIALRLRPRGHGTRQHPYP
jgi:hypothetical protein